jgi:multidrug efflux pump subunit AcrB
MILRTPTDIFPNINIPVIAVGWQYTGMNPEELEGRLTSGFERVLTTTVDNIEHIESTTVNGQSIIKIYLQPGASLDTANAQVTAISQTALRQSPPRRRHLSVMLISRTTRARPLFSPTASRLRRRLACY